MREGKAATERAKLVVCLRNCRRFELLLLILMWLVWSVFQNRSRHGSPCRARSMARMAEGRKCKIALPRTQRAFFFRRQARPCYNHDMKIPRMIITVGCLLGLLLSSSSFAAPPPKPLSQKIRVLLVTGGHPFEKEQFFKLFQDNPDITYQAVCCGTDSLQFSTLAGQSSACLRDFRLQTGNPAVGSNLAGLSGAAARHIPVRTSAAER